LHQAKEKNMAARGQAKAFFEPLRSILSGAISGTYADVGLPTENPVRIFKVSNNTKGDMVLSVTPGQDDMFVAAGAFTLYDVQANMNPQSDDSYVLPKGTQFRVKEVSAASQGAVYIEVIC